MLTYPPVKKVSVVIPVYNEQDSLPELLRRTDAACATLGRQYEILLIDDGSSDDSARMLTEAAEAEGSHVVAVLLNRNYGQHSAIMAGFSHVTGDLIITLDADLQNPPEEIPRLVAKADEGYDVVGTVRQNRQDSIFRKSASKMINRLIQRTTGKAMGDYGCMLRAYRRHIIDAMLNCHERSTFIPILANTFARRAVEIPVMHAEREFGDSKYSFMRLINLMYDLVTCLTTTPAAFTEYFRQRDSPVGLRLRPAAGGAASGLRSAMGGGRGVYALRRAVHVHRRPVCRYGPARGIYRPHL
ncbi:Polymyxin resistance protein ArnC, glycosyl transferase (plasmid) [Klebsiella aerogenes]|nr:Polymyxin resistance protein ArnC, glycosyl transferase [Klebsiella aerogenes]